MKNSFEKVKIDEFTFLIEISDRKIANLLCEIFQIIVSLKILSLKKLLCKLFRFFKLYKKKTKSILYFFEPTDVYSVIHKIFFLKIGIIELV